MDTVRKKGKQGFASMDPARQAEIARMGGSAVPASSRAFAKDKTLASAAGRRGGQTRAAKRDQLQLDLGDTNV